jgi:hypothetical protein
MATDNVEMAKAAEAAMTPSAAATKPTPQTVSLDAYRRQQLKRVENQPPAADGSTVMSPKG